MRNKFASALLLILTASFASAADSTAPKPAQVNNAVSETELATLKLTPKAEQRLGIVLVAAERKRVAVTRTFGGDVIAATRAQGRKTREPFSARARHAR